MSVPVKLTEELMFTAFNPVNSVEEAFTVVLLRFSVPPVREMFSVADNTEEAWSFPIVTFPPVTAIVFADNS